MGDCCTGKLRKRPSAGCSCEQGKVPSASQIWLNVRYNSEFVITDMVLKKACQTVEDVFQNIITAL